MWITLLYLPRYHFFICLKPFMYVFVNHLWCKAKNKVKDMMMYNICSGSVKSNEFFVFIIKPLIALKTCLKKNEWWTSILTICVTCLYMNGGSADCCELYNNIYIKAGNWNICVFCSMFIANISHTRGSSTKHTAQHVLQKEIM